MKKSTLINCVALVFLIMLGHYSYSANSFNTAKPNIVLILVDDAALQDFGCYGGEASTPNIDMLAERGMIFTNYHASPMCAPSRAMLLTGHDSHQTGVPNLPIFTPPEIAKIEGYEGVLNNKVLTVATRLKNAGYTTYTTGKWHLGHDLNTLPTRRGFDRSYILDASGADNYEHRPYLPTQASKPPWFKDGQRIDLPKDFYSSKNLVDEMIAFMDENQDKDKPFFAYLAFQAVHIPVQVPKEYTEKYIDTYSVGWEAIKKQRFEHAQKIGIVPNEAKMGTRPGGLKQWNDLNETQKKYAAKAMAVNAGMLEAMDHHIGRYIDYIKNENKFDNTVFIITSDNGPEASSAGDVATMKMWLKYTGYHQDYDKLGEKGSYNYIGPEFANAAAGPSSFFKFYAGEGGLRVPLIFSGPGIAENSMSKAFTFITDVTPTILSLAGIENPKIAEIGPMTGKDLSPLLQREAELVYSAEESVGMEAASHCALFKGDHKLIRNGKVYGDGIWRLYNLKNDPGEMHDLKAEKPQLFAQMISEYHNYSEKYGVVEMGFNYEPLLEIQNKLTAQIGSKIKPWGFGLIALLLLTVIWRRIKK
jgi:arylsulfatase/uncharacterized sulfatase